MIPLTREEAAAELDGNQYAEEGSEELWQRMKAAGLVAVFGGSDDLMEFRGAIYDEIGAYEGGTAYVSAHGLVQNKCDEGDNCPNWRQHGLPIEAIWAPESGGSWAYKTDIPNVTFDIKEDDELFCKGIVFRLADIPATQDSEATE